jgi:hypothetical protein
MELLTISPARSIFSNALNFCRRNAPLVRSPWRYCPRNAGGPRLAPRHATSPHIGISRSRASFLNNELRGSEHDPRNERERARIQQEMEDESGHGTLPITTQSPRSSATGPTPLLKLGGKVTARCPKFKQRYLSGAGEGSSACRRALYQMLNTSNVTRPMPVNSTASATESYSSQCQYVSTMSIRCSNANFFLGQRILDGHATSICDADHRMLLCEVGVDGLAPVPTRR